MNNHSLHPEARREIREIYAWYMDRDRTAAEGFAAAVAIALEEVISFPLRWPETIDGARRRLLRKFPYAVIYRVLPDRVHVVAVAHQRRRPGYWIRRKG